MSLQRPLMALALLSLPLASLAQEIMPDAAVSPEAVPPESVSATTAPAVPQADPLAPTCEPDSFGQLPPDCVQLQEEVSADEKLFRCHNQPHDRDLSLAERQVMALSCLCGEGAPSEPATAVQHYDACASQIVSGPAALVGCLCNPPLEAMTPAGDSLWERLLFWR